MSALARLSAFAALLLAVFAAAAFAGDRIGWTPGSDDPSPSHDADEGTMTMTSTEGAEHGADAGAGEEHGASGSAVPGLAVSDAGLTLDVERTALPRGERTELRFRILDAEGRPVRDFDVEHTKRMHLIVVRRDLTGFQHLHPTLRSDGTWTTPLRLDAPGAYRVFADFSHDGDKATLGTDVTVDGPARSHSLPPVAKVVDVDGFRVTLDAGAPRAGRESDLRFTVARDGRAVTPEPYLGARGHLVALREGDLGFLHVHPDADRLSFMTDFPSAGRYRLFLQFQVDGRVHTAAFTQEVGR